jgi:hypothetical protein
LLSKAAELGLQVEVVAELRFDIPKMYKHHKQKTADVEVDFIRFELPDTMRDLPLVPGSPLEPAYTPPKAPAPSPKSSVPQARAGAGAADGSLE